jgi:hypothetical protein
MKLEKFKNFMWGIAFGVCLSSVIHSQEILIPLILTVLIGIIFIFNFIQD